MKVLAEQCCRVLINKVLYDHGITAIPPEGSVQWKTFTVVLALEGCGEGFDEGCDGSYRHILLLQCSAILYYITLYHLAIHSNVLDDRIG